MRWPPLLARLGRGTGRDGYRSGVKPFLFLGIRPEDVAADDEYAAMLRCMGLAEDQLHRIRLDQGPLGPVRLDDYSGIVLGGGPFQVSDDAESKTPQQQRVESDLARLLDDVVAADFPFLGVCYGIGTLGRHEGGLVDRRYGEPVDGIQIEVTQAGTADALFSIAGASFGAFVGHKEALTELPAHAVLLASSAACPVQAFRVGSNVYATQFHPELDLAGLATRVQTYKFAGYFEPDQAEAIIAQARDSGVDQGPNLLGRFVEVYAR